MTILILALTFSTGATPVLDRKHQHLGLRVRNEMQKVGACLLEDAIRKEGDAAYHKVFDLRFKRQYNHWCGYAANDL